MTLPQMHGRTHCPTGSDPIPCLAAAGSWARQSQNGGSDTSVPVNSNVHFLNFNTSENSDATFFDLAASAQEIKVLQTGIYAISAQTNWTTYTQDPRIMWVVLVRTDQIVVEGIGHSNADDWLIAHGTMRLQANDRLQLWLHQDNGMTGTQTIYGGYNGSDAGGTDEGNYIEARYLTSTT